MKFLAISLAFLTGLLAAGPSAAVSEPVEVVRATTDQVLERIEADREQLKASPGRMYNLVSEVVFPHFDFGIMSQWVLGDSWKDADEPTREAFIEEFRKLLVRTYATALLGFSNQAIMYPDVEQKGTGKTATVKQEIAQPGGGSIPIVYRLHNRSGDWKVFDVSVDGVSLVKTYRASFGPVIRNDGLAGLIQSMSSKNLEYSE
jgi:phospholipid transport system substrate-binding protein